MRLVKTARTETKLARYEPKAFTRRIAAPIRGHRDHLGQSAFPVRPETLDAITLLALVLGISFDLACKGVLWIAVACGGQVAGGFSLLIVERRVVDSPG